MPLIELTKLALDDKDSLALHRIADSLEMIARALCPPPPDTEPELESVDEWEAEPVVDESLGLDDNMDIESVLELARKDAHKIARDVSKDYSRAERKRGGNGANGSR